MSKLEIIGLGALNMDNIYQVERILEDGEAVVTESASFPGGSAANTIYGLAKLGISAGFAGAVGDDAEGKRLRQDLQTAGVATEQVKVKAGARTGATLCLSDKLGRRSIYVLPGANSLLGMDDLDLSYLNQAKLLHISSFAGEKQLEVLRELMAGLDPSVKVSFSPGALYVARGLEALKPILSRTHIIFLNQQEMRQLTRDDISTGAEICLEEGCRVVAVTLGAGASYGATSATSYIMSAENEYVVEAIPAETAPAVDTTGAGDAFAAGFLYGFLNDRGLEDCGRLGDLVARFAIARAGARPGLPTFDELSWRYQQCYGKPL